MDRNKQLVTASGRTRIQRTFSEIATKPDEGGTDPEVKTTSSPKELSGCSHGSTLPETSTICRDKLSPTLSTERLVEVNELGPTIQQGVIQRPVQRHTQAAGERTRGPTVPVNAQQTTSVPSLQINGKWRCTRKGQKT